MQYTALFDLDGVLIETEWETFVFYKNYLKEHYEIELPDTVFQYKIGRKSSDFWNHALSDQERKIVDTEKLTLLKRELFNTNPDTYVKKVIGGKELIKTIRGHGWKTGLTTQNEERMMQTVLPWLDMKDLFDVTLSLKDITRKKPDPEIYIKAAEILGVKSADCVVIEDSEDGVCAAQGASMRCIAIRHPYTPLESLRTADIEVSSLTAVTMDLLEKMVKKNDSRATA